MSKVFKQFEIYRVDLRSRARVKIDTASARSKGEAESHARFKEFGKRSIEDIANHERVRFEAELSEEKPQSRPARLPHVDAFEFPHLSTPGVQQVLTGCEQWRFGR